MIEVSKMTKVTEWTLYSHEKMQVFRHALKTGREDAKVMW